MRSRSSSARAPSRAAAGPPASRHVIRRSHAIEPVGIAAADNLRQLQDDLPPEPFSAIQPAIEAALLLGEEVEGIGPALRNACDRLVEIPMYGKKESFNVSVAAGIALYGLKTK